MLLQQQPVIIAASGDNVVISLGNVTKTLHFETALATSRSMRMSARDARRSAGDTSHRWGVSGTLHDAAREGRRAALREKVRNVNRELLKASAVAVSNEGALVVWKLGTTTVKLPYNAAFTISQWIRLRAKEAQKTAGDIRHWATVATPEIAPALVH